MTDPPLKLVSDAAQREFRVLYKRKSMVLRCPGCYGTFKLRMREQPESFLAYRKLPAKVGDEDGDV